MIETMKIVSWNVNGICAIAKKHFYWSWTSGDRYPVGFQWFL